MSRSFAKKCFLLFHRWFGLVGGLYFVALGLTGSFLVYPDFFDRVFSPHGKYAQGEVRDVEIAGLIRSAQSALQTETMPMRISVPADPALNAQLSFNLSTPDRPRQFFTAFVDPSTLQTARTVRMQESVRGRVFGFHHDLFLGPTGHLWVAIGGIGMLGLILSGLWLWWPKRGRFFQELLWRKSRSRRHFHLQLHKLSGVYTILLMIGITFSGIVISKPDWFRDGPPPKRQPAPPVTTDFAALGKVQRPYEFKNQSPPIARQGMDVFIGANRDFHGGDFWGVFGEGIVFASGLLPLLFFITGFVVWRKPNVSS